jgi:hypothetical protein
MFGEGNVEVLIRKRQIATASILSNVLYEVVDNPLEV